MGSCRKRYMRHFRYIQARTLMRTSPQCFLQMASKAFILTRPRILFLPELLGSCLCFYCVLVSWVFRSTHALTYGFHTATSMRNCKKSHSVVDQTESLGSTYIRAPILALPATSDSGLPARHWCGIPRQLKAHPMSPHLEPPWQCGFLL